MIKFVIKAKGAGNMDIAAISTSASQYKLSQDVSIALQKKAMEVQSQTADSTIQMLSQCTNPNLGKNLDIRV